MTEIAKPQSENPKSQTHPTSQPAPENWEGQAEPAAPVSDLQRRLANPRPGLSPRDLLALQRTVGNQAVQRLLAHKSKATADDRRQDAESGSPHLVQRAIGVDGGETDANTESAIEQARGSGQGLPNEVQTKMEGTFGADFSAVRVHTDARSESLNRAVGARAFTTGNDIFVRPSEYSPGSREGQKLLAHELTHVVQQSGSAVQRTLSENAAAREKPDAPALYPMPQLRNAPVIPVVQRLVSTTLMVKDPVVIRKYKLLGQISIIYNPSNGTYFVMPMGNPFGPGAGTYTPEDLDFAPNFNYQGRDKLDVQPSQTTKNIEMGEVTPEKTESSGGLLNLGSNQNKLEEGFGKLDEDIEQFGYDDGYEDAHEDGIANKAEASFGKSANPEYKTNGAYFLGYKRGYKDGFIRGREDAESYSKDELEEAKQNVKSQEKKEELKGQSTEITHNEQEATERKKNAKAFFEDFIERHQATTDDILLLLPVIKDHFGLTNISYSISGDEMEIAYYASPPDYSHLKKVQHGPDTSKEANHPASAFKAKKSALTSLDKDAGLATPLGAIMNQLSLKDTEVELLAKGDTTKADRPKRVHATVVGTRRKKGGRVTGAVNPASIAHLGHHENMVLNKDETTWTSFYDGGHLIGDQLMPSSGPDTFEEWNLAPMEQVLNQQSYLGFVENVIAAGAEDTSGTVDKSIHISMIASVYYPDKEFTVKEKDLAASGFIPNDGTIAKKGNMPGPGGKPLSKKDRSVKIPSRIPYKWVLDAKIDDPSYTFQTKTAKPSKTAKSGNTAFPYFNYSDLKTKEIPQDDRHWWVLKGANKDKKTNEIKTAANQKTMHFEAYQYYPKRK